MKYYTILLYLTLYCCTGIYINKYFQGYTVKMLQNKHDLI